MNSDNNNNNNKIPSIKNLRKICYRKSVGGLLIRMCDYLAYYPAKIFLYLPLTPNQITILWITLKLFMLPVIAMGNYWSMVIGLISFQLFSIIDGVDGIVARYRKHYSLNGLYLDYIGHYLCNSLLLISIAIGIYNNSGELIYFIPAIIGMFSYLLMKGITINPSWYKEKDRKEIFEVIYKKNVSIKNQENKIFAIAGDFFLMDNPLNVMFWGVFLGLPGITLIVYSIVITLELFRKSLAQFFRIHRYEKIKRNKESSKE